MALPYALGLDLGTATVAAAVAEAGGSAEVVILGEQSVAAPVVVHLADDERLLTGDAAARRGQTMPERTARGVRRRLGDPTPLILGGKPFPASELLATVLRDVYTTVTAAQGEAPARTLLSRPAHWSPRRVSQLVEIARGAGVPAVGTVTDAEAAATRWAQVRALPEGGLVAVYDLGAGRFDAAVLVRGPEGMVFAGPPEGLEHVGGLDFDEALLGHLDYRTGGALSALDLKDPRSLTALARLRQEIVLARESLSRDTATTIPVYLPERHDDIEVSRTDLDSLLLAPLESTIGALTRVVRAAQVNPADLAALILTGGAARTPLVAAMVAAALPGVPVEVQTEQSVALGAALLATAPAPADAEHPSRGGAVQPPAGAVQSAVGAAAAPRAPEGAQPGFAGSRGPSAADAAAGAPPWGRPAPAAWEPGPRPAEPGRPNPGRPTRQRPAEPARPSPGQTPGPSHGQRAEPDPVPPTYGQPGYGRPGPGGRPGFGQPDDRPAPGRPSAFDRPDDRPAPGRPAAFGQPEGRPAPLGRPGAGGGPGTGRPAFGRPGAGQPAYGQPARNGYPAAAAGPPRAGNEPGPAPAPAPDEGEDGEWAANTSLGRSLAIGVAVIAVLVALAVIIFVVINRV